MFKYFNASAFFPVNRNSPENKIAIPSRALEKKCLLVLSVFCLWKDIKFLRLLKNQPVSCLWQKQFLFWRHKIQIHIISHVKVVRQNAARAPVAPKTKKIAFPELNHNNFSPTENVVRACVRIIWISSNFSSSFFSFSFSSSSSAAAGVAPLRPPHASTTRSLSARVSDIPSFCSSSSSGVKSRKNLLCITHNSELPNRYIKSCLQHCKPGLKFTCIWRLEICTYMSIPTRFLDNTTFTYETKEHQDIKLNHR